MRETKLRRTTNPKRSGGETFQKGGGEANVSLLVIGRMPNGGKSSKDN